MHLALFGTRRAQNPRERPPPRRPRRRLSIVSFASPPPKRRDAAPARACFVVKKKKDDKKYTPGRDERVFSIDAPAVRSGCRRVRVVVEIEALFARRGQAGHSVSLFFFFFFVVVTTTAQSVGKQTNHNLFSFFREQSFRAYFLNIIFRVLKNL